jgi:hypothetical protein
MGSVAFLSGFQENLKFNGKVHLQIGCDICHGDRSEKDFVVEENVFPMMGACLSCHDGKQARNARRTCHLTQPDGRIDTAAAGAPLNPAGWYFADAHNEAFLHNNRRAVQLNDGYCANCHKPKECIDCHNGVSKPLKIHPNNWVLQHPIDARRNTPECASCDRSQTFCIECHQQTKVTWEPEVAPQSAGVVTTQGSGQLDFQQRNQRFHPEGWAEFGQRGRTITASKPSGIFEPV